ncbi:13972_t:CDS:2, partial [Racocetra persica]
NWSVPQKNTTCAIRLRSTDSSRRTGYKSSLDLTHIFYLHNTTGIRRKGSSEVDQGRKLRKRVYINYTESDVETNSESDVETNSESDSESNYVEQTSKSTNINYKLGRGCFVNNTLKEKANPSHNLWKRQKVNDKSDNYSEAESKNIISSEVSAKDNNLYIDGVNIRAAIKTWRKSTKYVDEINKQDLLYYNIIDTIETSATKARVIFKDEWDKMINTIESTINPEESRSEEPQNKEPQNEKPRNEESQNEKPGSEEPRNEELGNEEPRNEELGNEEPQNMKKYIKEFMSKLTTWAQLENVLKNKKAELQDYSSEKYKKQALKLATIFKNQFEDDRNTFTEEQTEYNFIINFVSQIFKLLFKDNKSLKLDWGEKTLKASAVLKNELLQDDYRRSHGNKIDLVMSIVDIKLESIIMEVSGSPNEQDHTHYVGDRNKIAKMLKIIINYTITKYPGSFEVFRKIKVYGIQIYSKL